MFNAISGIFQLCRIGTRVVAKGKKTVEFLFFRITFRGVHLGLVL